MRNRAKSIAEAKALPRNENLSWLWIGLLLLLLSIFSLSIAACGSAPSTVGEASTTLPLVVSVDEAYQMYQDGTFFLDVRTQEEWDNFHAPNSTHIPLDQLESRLNELHQNDAIVVVCRSGNRSQTGRDILLNNGFSQVTSMAGGLNEWRVAGYPIE
jgi:rhodanese-related sulfurtransferase